MGFLDDVKEQINSQENREDIDVDEMVKKTAEAIKEHYMKNIKSLIQNNKERVESINYSDFLIITSPWVTTETEDRTPGFGEHSHRVSRVKTNEIAFEFNNKLREYLKNDSINVGELQKACLRYNSYDTACFCIDNGISLYSANDVRILERLSIYSDIEVHYVVKKKMFRDDSFISQNNKCIYKSSLGVIGENTGMTISFQYSN